MYTDTENVTNFDNFGVKHIPKEIYIGFIDFMLNEKSWLECSNLFSPDEYKKNEKIVLKFFQ